jgi:hypothetical protein
MDGHEAIQVVREVVYELMYGEKTIDRKLTVPELMHLKAHIDRELLDAISDEATPCPHGGTKWKLEDGIERCGICGRRIEFELPEAS